jgi:hypothetical protein
MTPPGTGTRDVGKIWIAARRNVGGAIDINHARESSQHRASTLTSAIGWHFRTAARER